MGCVSTRVSELDNYGIEPSCKNLKHLNTTTSTIWVDKKRDIVIKRKKRARPKEIKHTVENNNRIQNMLQHDNILAPMRIDQSENGFVFIFMPRASTDLYEITHSGFNLKSVLYHMHGIRDAIHWLHAHDIAHRDVKPENIVYHDNRLKLIDFDFCFPLSASIYCGSECYMYKSVLNEPENDSRRKDVYAFGKTILSILVNSNIEHRKYIWELYQAPSLNCYEECLFNNDIDKWVAIACECCASIPPIEIPTLPTLTSWNAT